MTLRWTNPLLGPHLLGCRGLEKPAFRKESSIPFGADLLISFFFFFFFWAHRMQDLSSPTRDGTLAPCSGSVES